MRQRRAYAAIREAHEETGYPIEPACELLIVSFVLTERNDNPLVFKTFDKAVQAAPDAHPPALSTTSSYRQA